MRSAEWIAIGYAAYVIAVAWIRLPLRRRLIVTVAALANIGAISFVARLRSPPGLLVRDWFPAAEILIGYWLSGLFFQQPMPRVERWLLRTDQLILDRLGGRTALERAPRAVLELLDFAYGTINVSVPAAFLLVYLRAPHADVDRYWSIVLSSELICYGMLPWIQTRTPRELGDPLAFPQRPLFFRQVNQRVLRLFSIQVNTIPSGHTAGSLASALVVSAGMPGPGAVLLGLSVLIGIGSVAGRYHYAADAVLGWVVAGVIAIGALP